MQDTIIRSRAKQNEHIQEKIILDNQVAGNFLRKDNRQASPIPVVSSMTR